MKTLREILLRHHESACPDLDRVRRHVLASELSPAPSVRQPGFLATILWPCPQAWVGLAAVWVMILGLHLAASDPRERAPEQASRPSPEILAVIREQRRLIAELMAEGGLREDARRRTVEPGPRSERRPAFIHA